MKLGEIAKARTALLNAGTTFDRSQLRTALMSHLAKDVETLGLQMATVRTDYRRKLERWRTQEVPENVWVSALPSDMHDSWLYRMTGIFALLCEMALAAWIFNWLGVGWWMGVATALGITLTLHGIFLHLFDNAERPKEAIHRLRTRVSLPAIFGFLVALAVGVLARYVQGELAVLLLPAFSFALWLGTLSLVILAASLFTVAHIQGWSAHHEKQYRQFDVDGWSPRRVREIPLPAKQAAVRVQIPGTEWASFANIRVAVHDAEEREWHAQVVAGVQHYREGIASALGALDREPVLPAAKHETPESDIVGLLRRLSQASEREPQFVVILTDLADTRYSNFPKLPPPQGRVRVLVLLVPAQPKDARLTLGKALAGPEQFAIRARQLREAAPWITVAPYFAHNLAELLGGS